MPLVFTYEYSSQLSDPKIYEDHATTRFITVFFWFSWKSSLQLILIIREIDKGIFVFELERMSRKPYPLETESASGINDIY